ncbi:hypothetical protein E8E12_003646 [Didymella heteroderae]|uniref:F-box domain-containing protein n=1 Tax=Didymella heteroderae TaxID=1769908 RepID=A0A9P4WLF6_9PLEO|nr:hypothetical protein E8E12_003646 [Didymella heteroderae]
MIVTIDDYRGAADAKPSQVEKLIDNGSKFTVADAGDLKLKLQALHRLLECTPLDQHSRLRFDDILQAPSSRTYVDGSEHVYFTIKSLSWPSKIPEAFIEAYREVLQSRPFTNRYIYKPIVSGTWHQETSISARSAATFSAIRPLLPELDSLCDTELADYYQRAEYQVKPFAFMRLPTELRFEVYDYLSPAHTLLRVFAKDKHDSEQRSPVRLDIMRVSRALYKETTDRFFNGSTLYIEAYPDLRGGVWIQSYFTKITTIEYVARVMRMSSGAKSRVTQLEIRIFPEDAASPINSFRPEHLDTSSLRRICTELPSLESILISFEKVPKRLHLLDGRARWPNETSFYNGQRFTLAWIHAQLPDEGPQIFWDLTHFRQSVVDSLILRQEILSQPMMKESVQRDGALGLAQSANATQEDSQRWSEIRDIVSEAVAPRRSNIFSLG